MAARRNNWWASTLSLVLTLALVAVPLPDSVAPLRPDWVAVVLLYWSLMAPRHFSLLTAFWMGIALDTLSGALLGQNALALLVVVYLAEKFHLRLRVFPLSQLAITVFLLLGLYEFVLFWIDGMAGRSVPLVERWVPPLTGTLVWVLLYMMFDRREREAPARLLRWWRALHDNSKIPGRSNGCSCRASSRPELLSSCSPARSSCGSCSCRSGTSNDSASCRKAIATASIPCRRRAASSTTATVSC